MIQRQFQEVRVGIGTSGSFPHLDGKAPGRKALCETLRVHPDTIFGTALNTARQARIAFLKQNGLWSERHGGIDPAAHKALSRALLTTAAAAEQRRSGRHPVSVPDGGRFEGVYEKPVTVATGRFALVARAKEFTLVPWRPEIERHRGTSLTLRRAGQRIDWTLGRSKGLGR